MGHYIAPPCTIPKSYREDVTEGLNLLTLPHPMEYPLHVGAQVAELVDAQVSGTCGRKVVEVRVFSWAPNIPTATQHKGDPDVMTIDVHGARDALLASQNSLWSKSNTRSLQIGYYSKTKKQRHNQISGASSSNWLSHNHQDIHTQSRR